MVKVFEIYERTVDDILNGRAVEIDRDKIEAIVGRFGSDFMQSLKDNDLETVVNNVSEDLDESHLIEIAKYKALLNAGVDILNSIKYGDEVVVGGKTIKLVDPSEEVSETPWGEVDKTELKRFILDLAEEDEDKALEIAELMFGLVRCVDSDDCLKFPYAEVIDDGNGVYKVVVNRKALPSVISYAIFSRQSEEDIRTIFEKIAKIYDAIGVERPRMLERYMSSVDVAVGDIDYISKETGVDGENIITVLSLVRDILNSAFRNGMIDIDGDIVAFDNPKVVYDLSKVVGSFIADIVSVMSGEMPQSNTSKYTQAVEEMSNKVRELNAMVDELRTENMRKDNKIRELEEYVSELNDKLEKYKFLRDKYEAILSFISQNANGRLKEITTTISEANNSTELEYVKKMINRGVIGNSSEPARIKLVRNDIVEDNVEVKRNSIGEIVSNYI